MKKLSFLVLLTLCFANTFAQISSAKLPPIDMADELRSNGKIYVVVLTIAIIFVGLSIYLFSIDRRLKKIEKEK
ncbi:MAG: CcmD family protein [Mucilaginibacter sp.]|nr:CcmD family protein [Mucilaginibacter sp.]